MIHFAIRKKDENGNDVDLEIKFGVEDLRRLLELGDSDNDPTIIPGAYVKDCGIGWDSQVTSMET
ncbi:hypothetical protein Hanom_Chr10g00883201 [Helianthus anomalus]